MTDLLKLLATAVALFVVIFGYGIAFSAARDRETTIGVRIAGVLFGVIVATAAFVIAYRTV